MNVFVLRSPFSYVNCLEFRDSFQLKPEACYLLVGYKERESIDVRHILRLYEESDWAGMTLFPQSSTVAASESRLANHFRLGQTVVKPLILPSYAKLLKAILPCRQAERVILQNIDDFAFVHIANSLRPTKVYCLDEGPKSLYTNSQRTQRTGLLQLGGPVHTQKRKLLELFFGYHVQRLAGVSYFSCYDMVVGPGEKLIRHSFSFMRSKALRLPRDENLLLFAGSSLSEVGIVDEQFYLETLATIRRQFAEKNMVYVAHRADCRAKLDKIEKDLAIPVVSYDMPFELQIAMFGPVPGVLVSFYSSVLVNCHEMFQSSLAVVSYRIPLERISAAYREEIALVYRYFDEYRSSSFLIRDL